MSIAKQQPTIESMVIAFQKKWKWQQTFINKNNLEYNGKSVDNNQD